MKNICYFFILSLVFAACKNDAPKNTLPSQDVVAANVDTTINPSDDFFQFVHGRWFKNNPIPSSESSWGIGKVLQKDIYDKMRKVSEAAAANTAAPKGSSQQKIGDYWASGMDTAKIEAQGIEPIKEELAAIEGIKNIKDLLDVVAQMQNMGVAPLFSSFVYQDLKNSNQYSYYLFQGGLGLSERDYYFNTDSRNRAIREEYNKHLQNIFKLLGDTEGVAEKKAEAVFQLEVYLAKSHRKIEELRDQYKNYNKMSIADLQKLTPSVSWADMMAKTGVTTDSVVVGQPEFYKTVETSLTNFDIYEWKSYLKTQLIDGYAKFLNRKFEDEDFNFHGRVLEGKKEQKPRWKSVLDAQ